MQRLRLFRKPHPAQEIFALDELVEDSDQDVLGDEQHEQQGEGVESDHACLFNVAFAIIDQFTPAGVGVDCHAWIEYG